MGERRTKRRRDSEGLVQVFSKSPFKDNEFKKKIETDQSIREHFNQSSRENTKCANYYKNYSHGELS